MANIIKSNNNDGSIRDNGMDIIIYATITDTATILSLELVGLKCHKCNVLKLSHKQRKDWLKIIYLFFSSSLYPELTLETIIKCQLEALWVWRFSLIITAKGFK